MDARKESTETPLVRVPYEALKRSVRDEGKASVEEVAKIVERIQGLGDGQYDRNAALKDLDVLRENISQAKRKFQDREKTEGDLAKACSDRLSYLVDAQKLDEAENFHRERLDRFLVDYMLRESWRECAQAMIKCSKLGNLVDLEIFLECQRISSSLNSHSCASALEWCGQNAARLRKMKSSLEFNLRVQEFIEIVKRRNLIDAVHYARKHLTPWSNTYSRHFYETMGVLVFSPETKCSRYVEYFSPQRWNNLVQWFKRDFFRLHNLSTESLLSIHLQAGLSVLNSHRDTTHEVNIEDPMQLRQFQVLAEGLPHAKHLHSKIFCLLTREIMTDENPPLLLPNGMVYSKKGLEGMASLDNGWVTCPRTGYRCKLEQAEKLYIS